MNDRNPDPLDSKQLAHQAKLKRKGLLRGLFRRKQKKAPQSASGAVGGMEGVEALRRRVAELEAREKALVIDNAGLRAALMVRKPSLQEQTLVNVREREADEPCKCQVCIDWYGEDGRPGTSPEPVTKPKPPQWADASQKLEARNIADAEKRRIEAAQKASNEAIVTRAIGPPKGVDHE